MSDNQYAPLLDEEFQDTIVAYLWRTAGKLGIYSEKVDSGFFQNKTTGTIYFELTNYWKEHKKLPSGVVMMDIMRKNFRMKKTRPTSAPAKPSRKS
jgi:hypothetical protein